MAEPWFNPITFGSWYGALAGSGAGLLGAAIGTIGGMLAPRGRGRPLVMGLVWLLVITGIVQVAFGLAALAGAQPYAIWYFPLLCGGLCTGLGLMMVRVFHVRYAQAEQRRLQADGLRHS